MSKLASFVAGFGGGYLKARDKEYDRERQAKLDERQAKLDAQQEEQFGWARNTAAAAQRERDDREARRKAIAEGMDVGKVREAAQVSYTGTDGAQKTAAQPDLQTAQFAADQQRLEENQSLAPPATPSAPRAEQTASVRTLDGARRLFSGLTAAADAKKFADENPVTPYAKYMALSERLATMTGGQEEADAYLKRAKEAEKEGAFRTIALLDANQHEAAAQAFNSAGDLRLQPGQKFATVTDAAGNKTHRLLNADGSVAIPDVQSALLFRLAGIEGVAKQADARAATRAKVQEELFKPRVLKPGEKFGALDPTDGKWKEFAEGGIPAGYEVMTDAQGNTVLRKIDGGRGAGTGAGEKPKDPLAEATKAVEFVITNSAAKGALEPQQVARANTVGRQLVASALAENRGLDPAVASEIAINVATGKVAPTTAFNPRTGTIDSVVDYQGSNFALESLGTPQQNRLKPEQVAPVLAGFLSKMPADVRKEMIPAAYNQQARNSLQEGLRAEITRPEWAASFRQANGRAPTEADINAAVANRTKLLDAQLNLISLYGGSSKENGDPIDPGTRKLITETLKQSGYTIRDGKAELSTKKPEVAATAPAAQRLQQPGGLGPLPTLAQRRQAVQAAKDRLAAEDAEATRAAAAEAQRLLQAGDVPALARLQASSAFGRLDQATKTAIYKKVNGLQ